MIRRAGRAPLGALLLVIAVLWLGAAIHGLVTSDSAIVPGLGAGSTYLVGVLGVALALLALDWMARRRTVVISHGAVAVTDRSLHGGPAWREPLANYRKIRAYQELRTHRTGVRSWYVVQLWHPDPAKAIELARAKNPALIERCARDWARRLGLPLSSQLDEPTAAATRSVPSGIGAIVPGSGFRLRPMGGAAGQAWPRRADANWAGGLHRLDLPHSGTVRYARRVAPPEGVGLWAPLHVHFHEFRILRFLLHCRKPGRHYAGAGVSRGGRRLLLLRIFYSHRQPCGKDVL